MILVDSIPVTGKQKLQRAFKLQKSTVTDDSQKLATIKRIHTPI